MPELPEVERVRLSLADRILGQSVRKVELRRADVVRFDDAQSTGSRSRSAKVTSSARQAQLLQSLTITSLERHGKQLAILGEHRDGAGDQSMLPCICVHLGMSGSLLYRLPDHTATEPHTHVIWHLSGGGRLIFRDPRRFGGIWTFSQFTDLQQSRWARLGADALLIKPRQLHARLQTTSRALKAALLDQHLIAGLGNIYVDELLFQCRIHPQTPANAVSVNDVRSLVHKMRRLLSKAIQSGGSSLRDYVDGEGRSGAFQLSHLVYGRAGMPCSQCSAQLMTSQVAGRTTVFCPACQRSVC